MAVQQSGSRRQVDAHFRRGLSYWKIGLRWLAGVVHKARPFLRLDHLFRQFKNETHQPQELTKKGSSGTV